MFQSIINRIYRMKIGTRTAISYFAVIMVVLAFTTSSILLLQYGKNIDIRIASSFSPVISAIKDYQFLIEETGRLSTDISIQANEVKRSRLKKIHERIYNRQKITLIGLCQEPGLADVKKRIIGVDKKFENTLILEKKLLAVLGSDQDYNDPQKLAEAKILKDQIDNEISKLRLVLSETSLQAISVFNKLDAQKFASYRTLSYLLLIMIIVIALLGVVSIYITNITIIKPIKELSAILDEVGAGKIIQFQSHISREDEIGDMINSAQKVVQGFKNKEQVANAIGKGDYDIKVPMLSRRDRLGKALSEMRDNLKLSKEKEVQNLKSLEAYTLSLKKKNKELDQFAYITSHDLKSPLRGINNLAEWIQEDMGEKMSEESFKYFNMLRGRVHRMEALINSILQYSRAGKTPENQEKTSSKQVVYDVLERIEFGKCTVLVDDLLPEVTANRKDLQEVFNVFISNAINHNTSTDPILNISYRRTGDKITFCVADNGPGIAEEFHEKIFTIFQTLERRDEVENIGAGLAIGKKIIEDYGGKVWVESELGKGANFYFEWPV
ncbi:MAG: ATP-binding protein [Bacteroidia bacterium]|nr:ATP-binding protein [Bacteroidia bacterium]